MNTIVISNKMEVLSHFVVHVPKTLNDTITIGGKEIYLENKYNPFEHRVMSGEVVFTPKKYDTGVSVGDTLYFHHHVILTPQLFDQEKQWYRVNYDPFGGNGCQAFAYKDNSGQIHAIEDWVILDPIYEKGLKSDVIEVFTTEEVKNRKGIIKYDSRILSDWGLKKGDVVYFSKDADYEMEIEGDKVWRMLHDYLIAVEK